MSSNFKEIEPKTLKKLHIVEVEILDEIDRVCKKNNIEYFLIGGTLLGAIRHKGFIPWDDDLDVGMTRENYEKFINIAPNELDSKYYLDNFKTNTNCYLPFSKIRKNNTTMDEKVTKNFNNHKGIFVDIFPFDKLKDKFSFFTKLRVTIIRAIIETVFVKKKIYPTYKKCRYPFLSFILSMFSCNTLFKIQEKLCIKDNNKNNAKYYAGLVGSYAFRKECFLEKELFPLVEVEFEGKEYPAFKNYDSFLTSVYGDYMKLPPREQRVNHSILKIDFENGEIRKNK